MSQHDTETDSRSDETPLPVVGIGASAGGLAAFETLFENLPDDTGLAYVVVQHLSPNQKSELSSILQRYASVPVETIEGPTPLRPDHVYVLPSATSLLIEDNELRPDDSQPGQRQHLPIDHFFQSLAENRREHAIGIVLSGTRDDGSRGTIAIKLRGGLTFAQSPEEAEYDSMPRSAIETGHVDLVLPTDQLARHLVDYVAASREAVDDVVAADDGHERAYRRIVDRLRSVTGHDFSNYKRSTMLRRIARRIRLHKLDDIQEYSDHLDDNTDEVLDLFDELLITVTEFFRDPEAFEALEEKVIPELYDNQAENEPIRVWIPACSSGEEVYSIAMLLWEEAERRDQYPEFKLFATDLDKHAIEQARQGLFSRAACAPINPQRRERFFEPEAGGYRIVNELRDRVLFAVHDILKDPPFARQDLISCRNLLIYLDNEAQRRVFDVVHYALREEGRLFLGASEFIGEARDLFEPIDKAHRIYRPKPVGRRILPLSDTSGAKKQLPDRKRSVSVSSTEGSRGTRLEHEHHRMLNRRYAPPSILVDRDYEIVHVAGDAQNFLRIPPGKPTTDILEVVPAAIRLKLRSALIDVFEQGQRITSGNIVFEQHGERTCLRLVIQPMTSPKLHDEDLVQILFETVDDAATPETIDTTEVDDSTRRIVEQLEAENNRLNDELETTIERYETTTEELKTSNEELLTINEELQSTTEELETSKEELESTNEELTTVNDELSDKVSELDDVNSDLKNLLSSTAIGTIFLDRSLKVRRFTEPVCDYINLLETDLGRPIQHVTHNLDYDELIDDLERVIEDLEPIEREVRSRDGSCYIARINPYRTVDDRIAGAVLTFFDITDRKKAQQRVAERELLFRTIFQRASDALFLFHLDDSRTPTTFSQVNESACQRLGYSHRELSRMTLRDIIDPSSVDLGAYLTKLRDEQEAVDEVRLRTRSGELVDDEMSSRLFSMGNEPTVITVSRDISSHKDYEQALMAAKEESEQLAELRASFLANMSHEIRTPLTSIIGISQLLGKKDLPYRQGQMVELIQTSGQRLQQTLDSVLDISRLEAGEMVPSYQSYDLVSQIEEDVEMLRPMADDKDLELTFRPCDSEVTFGTDPGFLSRIVYNLTQNAIKFTREGRVVVRLEREGNEITLTVSDTGIGIDEEFLPNLFDKFKQASIGTGRDYEGSGLGLSLVQHLIELLEGSISVDSEKGEGTTFTVVIPEHSPEESADEEKEFADDAQETT